jgi:hypothetical protein
MLRNIDACQQLSKMTRTALGPHGKFIISELLNKKYFFSALYFYHQLILNIL